MQSLDQQEREVHQTQLRVLRDQTSSFVRDLAAVKTELVDLKLTLGNVQSKSSSDKSLIEISQKKHMQVVDGLLKQLMEQNQQMATQDKLASVKEQMELSFRENFQKLAEAQQTLDGKAQQRLEALEEQVSELQQCLRQHQEKQQEMVQDLQLDHKEQLQESHGVLQQRLNELHVSHSTTANSHQELGEKMTIQHGLMRDCLAKLQESHQEVNQKHETLAKYVDEVTGEGGCIHKKLNDMQEVAVNAVQEHVHSIRAQGRKLEAHQLSFEERLEHLEGMFTELFEKSNREAEEDKESLRLVVERMEYLERLLGRRKGRGDDDDGKRVSYSIHEQLTDHDDRLKGLESSTAEQQSRLWMAIDTHTHDLSSQTLRKSPSHGSLETSPMSRSPPVTAPVLVPSMPTVPIVAGSTHGACACGAVRVATVLPMSPAKVNGQGGQGGQGPAGFVERIPSNVSKAASQRQFSNSLASVNTVNTVNTMASSSRTLSPSAVPYPWPEEVERISCGQAHYDGSRSSCAELPKG